MSRAERISKLNAHLRSIGSKFSTEDGIIFTMLISIDREQIMLLKKQFESIGEAERFVYSIAPKTP